MIRKNFYGIKSIQMFEPFAFELLQFAQEDRLYNNGSVPKIYRDF